MRSRGPLLALSLLSLLSPRPAAGVAPWWDTSWQLRAPLTISVRPDAEVAPGVTLALRVSLADWRRDGLVREDCGDLRLVLHAGQDVTVVPHALLRCDATAAELAFHLQRSMPVGGSDADYWLYAAAPDATTPTGAGHDAVFLYDLASDPDPLETLELADPAPPLRRPEDPQLRYEDGRLHYELGDGEGLRLLLPADSGDLALEAVIDHHACQPLNMRSGLALRTRADDPGSGIRQVRAWNQRCGGPYSDDGVVMHGDEALGGRAEAPVPAAAHRLQLAVASVGDELEVRAGTRTVLRTAAAERDGDRPALLLGQDSGSVSLLRLRRVANEPPAVALGATERRLLASTTACDAGLPYESSLDASTVAWLGDRLTLRLDLDLAATLEDPRHPAQLLRLSAAGAGGVIRFDLLPGRQLRASLATRARTAELTARAAVAPGRTLRIELRYDGEELQLWSDGQLQARTALSGDLRRGDGPFDGLEGLGSRAAIRRIEVYGAALNRSELGRQPEPFACAAEPAT